jgi:hypothetical protein
MDLVGFLFGLGGTDVSRRSSAMDARVLYYRGDGNSV